MGLCTEGVHRTGGPDTDAYARETKKLNGLRHMHTTALSIGVNFCVMGRRSEILSAKVVTTPVRVSTGIASLEPGGR